MFVFQKFAVSFVIREASCWTHDSACAPCTPSRKVSFLPPPLIMAENVGKHFELMDEVIEVAGFSFPLHIFPLNLCLTASDKCIKAPSQCLLDGFPQEPMT